MEQEEDQEVCGEGGGLCGAGGGSGGLDSRRRIMWSRRRIRWSGEQEEDQEVCGAGGGLCGAGGGSGGLESRRRIMWPGEQMKNKVVLEPGGGSGGLESRRKNHMEQEEDQVVWRGGGSCGLESRRKNHMEQEEDQVIWGAEALKEDLVTNASGEWRCILNGGPSHSVPQLLFSVNFFSFRFTSNFILLFFKLTISIYTTLISFLFFKNLFRAFFLPFTVPSSLVSTLFILYDLSVLCPQVSKAATCMWMGYYFIFAARARSCPAHKRLFGSLTRKSGRFVRSPPRHRNFADPSGEINDTYVCRENPAKNP